MTCCTHRKIFGILLTLVCCICACDSPKKIDDYHTYAAVSIDQPAPEPVTHVLGLLGLEPADLVRPFHQEAGYHLVSRMPLIDQVAESPFYLHGWADDTSNELQRSAAKGLFPLLSLMIRTLNGGVAYKMTDNDIAFSDRGLLDAYIQLCRQYHVAPDHTALRDIEQAGFTEVLDKQLGQLLSALTQATLLTQKAFAALNQEERFYISSLPERYFFPAGAHFYFLTAPTHVPDHIVSLTRKIDFVRLHTAGLIMAGSVDRFVSFFQGLPEHRRSALFFTDAKKRDGVVLDLPSPVGNLTVFGQGGSVITGGKALVVDLGGDDRYLGDVSVGSRVPGRVSVAIDTGGDDVYDRGTRRFGQGFGCLALGMMVDISGNDKYVAGNMAQGSGMYGIGVLADLAGQDSYQMGLMGQGFGLFGIGLLLDAEGNDRYIVNGMGQGAGSTMGFGGLVDIRGKDKYLADPKKHRGLLVADKWSHAQGAGLSIRSPEWRKRFSYYGGIGFLSDGGGDDFYFSGGGNCMGSSYFMSIGALVDHGGDDQYMPQNGYGLGFAVHLSNAILIDHKGNDIYYGKTHTGGVGSDRSVAILADYAGDDTYGPSEEYAKGFIGLNQKKEEEFSTASVNKEKIYQNLAHTSYASALKPKALGILIDYSGSDRYFASPLEKGESCGGVLPPADPQHWSHAMLLDLGGNDFYYKKGRKNNHYFKYLHHGICYDTEYAGAAQVAKRRLPALENRSMTVAKIGALFKDSPVSNDVMDLANQDLAVRYAAKGKIIQKGAATISDLTRLLSVSDDREFNRDVIEILDTFLITGELNESHHKQLQTLLRAADPFVRIFAAGALGSLNIHTTLPALRRALSEKNDTVRYHIIQALEQAVAPEMLEVLISVADTDPSAPCRRAGVIALNKLAEMQRDQTTAANAKLRSSLLKAMADPDETVRTSAAVGLRIYGKQPAIVDALVKHTRDDSVYVRRMAAKSLILNGFKEGIPVLIETLKFKSIDTFENYDHEIAKDLAFYTGVDFPGQQRYAYATWHQWWQNFGSSVNLKQNLDIMRNIEKAFDKPDEDEGIAIFERLMAQNPANIVVRRRYLRYCEEWLDMRLLTQKQLTPEILERCLRLQRIIANLEPQVTKRWERLAYYYARLFRYEEAAAAMEAAVAIEPENNAFNNILKQYRRLAKEAS